MKKWWVKDNLLKATGVFLTFAILIIAVSIYLIEQNMWIGPAYIVLAFLGFFVLNFAGIKKKAVYPDIIFGIIDNGVLIFTILLGDKLAGLAGAVLGGAAGNTLTDGFGGLIEGKVAQKLRYDAYEENRTPLSTMLGKVIGCLLGAGMGLILVWFFNIIWTLF